MLPDLSRLERLRAIGLTPALLQQLHSFNDPADARSELLRVTEVHRDSLLLHDGDDVHPARQLPALRQRLADADDALAVGDWVLAWPPDNGQRWVHARVPPLNQLARRLHDGRDKVSRAVIVSNVDTALLLMGLDHDFNLRRLERYHALVRMAGVQAVVVLSKADLCSDAAARRDAVRELLPQAGDVVAVNALDDTPRRALAPWLGSGQTLVLLGSSGAGKSTLTNTLAGRVVQATGAARADDSRGRHTTTARSLHAMPGGACIIDTPGLRTLRLDGEPEQLGAAFDDIASLASACRFRDCRHADEPGCAVRASVAAERLRSYQKLLREARRDSLTALERKAQQAEWKSRSRAARARLESKRG